MKNYLLPIVLLFLFSGCKKVIENIQEDLVIKAMTDGQWVITRFTQDGSDITTNFTGYKFQYYENKTVDAIKNNVFEKKGNWDGNASNMTTYANFANAVSPLDLINGTWHIDRNGWTYVEATQTINGTTKTMRLDKL